MRKYLRKIKQLLLWPVILVKELVFLVKHLPLRNEYKFIYTLTPQKQMVNIGDHAQAVAINRWFEKHWPSVPVIELDKFETKHFIWALKIITRPSDIIFIHSGGNLGDRGIISETVRRKIIKTFHRNKIISLPQTIFFSDTPEGCKQREITTSIYNKHPDLTIIGRDPKSGELARELFPSSNVICMPDFVLSLTMDFTSPDNKNSKVLLCLRQDKESVLTKEQKEQIKQMIPYESDFFDTTLDKNIPKNQRHIILKEVLEYFSHYDAVITDRYHGLIFSVTCKKPTIVFKTIDHKLTSAIKWFEGIPFVYFAQHLEDITDILVKALQNKCRDIPDWNEQYFNKLPEQLGIVKTKY